VKGGSWRRVFRRVRWGIVVLYLLAWVEGDEERGWQEQDLHACLKRRICWWVVGWLGESFEAVRRHFRAR